MKILLIILRKLKQYHLFPSMFMRPLYLFLKRRFHTNIPIVTRFGVQFNCDVSEWIDFNIFFNDHYEPNESKHLLSKVNPGDIFFDVGANIGYYSMLMAFKGAIVHSFEPFPATYSALCKNKILNKFDITTNNCAISSSKGEIKLFVSPDALGNNSVEIDYGQYVHVASITIDDYCKEKHIDCIDFMKIDVEGHEISVLKGANRMLKNKKIKAIMIEIKNHHKDKDLLEFLSLIYNAYSFSENGLNPITLPFDGNILLTLK